MNVPREGSRKAEVFAALQSGGSEAAYKAGAKLKLSPSSVKSWLSAWQRGSNGQAPKPRKESKEGGDDPAAFFRRFPFDSKEAAQQAADNRLKDNRMDPRCFVIVGPDEVGRWNFVPRHLAHAFGIEIELPVLKDKQRVRDLTKPDRQGIILKAGPEVCEVKWDEGRTENENIAYLDAALPASAAKPKGNARKGKGKS
jgi:hypothetical protein